MKVFVYFNLHRKCWSIKALEGPSKGRVIGHAHYVDLACVEWRVSEAGRQRVLREKKKNVHAGAVGKLEAWSTPEGERHGVKMGESTFDRVSADLSTEAPLSVTYNPYKGPTFTEKFTGIPVHRSEVAYLCPDRRIYTYGSN